MGLWGRGIAALAGQAIGWDRGGAGPRGEDAVPGWGGVLSEPRNLVFAVLALVLFLGGGRKWLQGLRARRAVVRLNDPAVTAEEVRAAARHGREGYIDLFRILGTAEAPGLREAAGQALARLWADDQLIAEEEKAIARRGFAVTWRARRRYPRALRAPIPVVISYGIPFLGDEGGGIGPENLEWSHRVLGAGRISLETFSPWEPGSGRVEFRLEPGDFPANGPHRLVLQARVRTRGLTDSWEFELPHMPFSFEFDPHLDVDALLTLPDDARAQAIARALRLARPEVEGGESRYLILDDDLALREPPDLAVTTPLPCDLAHRLEVEFEGIPGRFAAGEVLLSGQGDERPAEVVRLPLGPIAGLSPGAIDRPGERRLRAVLVADPDRGWADPDVRSIWPGTLETDWETVRVVRR